MQVQRERDELYDRFVKAIHEVQQKSGLKNILLEKKLSTLADALEKKVRMSMFYMRMYVVRAYVRSTCVCDTGYSKFHVRLCGCHNFRGYSCKQS